MKEYTVTLEPMKMNGSVYWKGWVLKILPSRRYPGDKKGVGEGGTYEEKEEAIENIIYLLRNPDFKKIPVLFKGKRMETIEELLKHLQEIQ